MAICGIWCKYVDILVYKVKGAKQTEREQDASHKLLQAGDRREAQDLERYHAGSAIGLLPRGARGSAQEVRYDASKSRKAMNTSPLEGWDNFYVILGSAAAGLMGLT